MQGMRVYFAENTIKEYKIRREYRAFKKKGYSRTQALETLSNIYCISTQRVEIIIRKKSNKIEEIIN